jgi:hypothetical protein
MTKMDDEPLQMAIEPWIQSSAKSPDRILEPMDRISEVLFGLIMALTFTLTLGVVTAERIQVSRRPWLQLGLGNYRCKRVSDGALQPKGAHRHAAIGFAHRRYQ